MLKIELEMNGDEEDMPKKPSALQKKVAQIIARENGRKKPNKDDMMRAAKVDDEEDED